MDRCIGGDKLAGGYPPSSIPGLWELLPFPQWLQTPSVFLYHLGSTSLPSPHDGLIPVTSTEAPVMYPLSSDAKNATTSATSMGIMRREQNAIHSHKPKGIIISEKHPLPPEHTSTTNPGETQIPQTLGSVHLGPTSPHSAHPQGPQNVPSGSL